MASARKRARQRRDAAKPVSVAFLRTATHSAVRSVLAAAAPIATFWETVGTLTLAERRRIVEQALVLIGENYVHLPLKRTMHATDPAQALRLLKYRLDSATTATMGSEIAFHSEMLRIFASVRDLHTNYLLPAPFADKIAFLPFDVEEYYANGVRRYQVSHVVQGFTHPKFEAGVEIIAWSGVPIERAVDISADRNAGSNPAARHARGLQFLALRPLVRSLPPDEEWVEVDYIDLRGTRRRLRFDWMVFSPNAQSAAGRPSGRASSAALGIDLEMEMATRAKRVLFAPAVVAASRRRPRLTTRAAAADSDVPTAMPNAFRARSVTTLHGPLGHLRIFTFNVDDPDAFVAEAERLIGLLPQTMLVLDVRGNGGGHIYASEGLLQLFTPRTITPEPTQFIVSPLNRRICYRHRANPLDIDLGPWLASMDQANFTNAVYSTGYPITPVDFANARGQRYRGRVLCITDARCYSATDIFAAGFQDHQIGLVLGVDGNTGAGGANVWTHGLLKELLDKPPPGDPSSPYRTLPKGAGMRVSIRRTLRVHERAGSPLEDLGVEPDRQWRLTRNDLLNSNADLLEHAAGLLAAQPLRVLEAQAGTHSDGIVPISVTTANLSRLDIYVDDRPYGFRKVTAGTITLGVPQTAKSARFDGFSGSMLVASNRLDL